MCATELISPKSVWTVQMAISGTGLGFPLQDLDFLYRTWISFTGLGFPLQDLDFLLP
jgi:hypothetical protein